MKIGVTTLRNVGNSFYVYVGRKVAGEVGYLVGKEFVMLWDTKGKQRLVIADVDTYHELLKDLFELG